MATRQAHAPAESGEASVIQKTLPTSSEKPGQILVHGIVFIPSGGNVGALPTGLSGGGGEGFGVASDPSPVHNEPPPPSPTPQPQAPQPQPPDPSPQAPQQTRSAAPLTHEQPSAPTPTSPTDNRPSNDRSPTIIDSGGATDSGGASSATNTPLPTELGVFPLSASASRAAVPVSSCDGTDACITVSGKTFSFVPTGAPSTTSVDTLTDGAGPSFSVLYPSVAPKGLDVIQDNPFRGETLKIISICTMGYFFVAIASIFGIWLITRSRRRKQSLEYV